MSPTCWVPTLLLLCLGLPHGACDAALRGSVTPNTTATATAQSNNSTVPLSALRGFVTPNTTATNQRNNSTVPLSTNTNTTTEPEPEPDNKQQTSVQSFINSYESGSRFNDTTLTGITGPIPGSHPVAQVQHNPMPGTGAGVISSGGAATGTTGIAGGVTPGLGQSGTGAGGAGIGSSTTGLGTTAGTIGQAPSGAGFVGPSGIPAPIAAPGGVGGVASPGGGGII